MLVPGRRVAAVSAPGVILEVQQSPSTYSQPQLDRAIRIATALKSSRLILFEPPELGDR